MTTKQQSTNETLAERCVICGVPRPKVPGPATYPPYYCLKHREHIEGKRCIDPECPVCVKGDLSYAEHATTPAAPLTDKWSKESPKVNGVYWWRSDARDTEPDIHRVVDGIFFEVGEQFPRVVESFGGEWLGPITPAIAISPAPASTAPVVDNEWAKTVAETLNREGWLLADATSEELDKVAAIIQASTPSATDDLISRTAAKAALCYMCAKPDRYKPAQPIEGSRRLFHFQGSKNWNAGQCFAQAIDSVPAAATATVRERINDTTE